MERLYNAAVEGDLSSLLNLLHEDPLILDRYNIIDKIGRFSQSPLHMAASFGHIKFVTEIMRIKPNMCLARDEDGYNPVHVSAMEGRIEVIEKLLTTKPQAAREQTADGETALHLCVRYNQFEALKLFVKFNDVGLLNSKDKKGNTILHLAVTAKQYEMVTYLLENKNLEKDAINTNGLTAKDICLASADNHMMDSLEQAKALDAETVQRPANKLRMWLETQTNSLMVVASLIATMAFQVGVNPPGGFWGDDKDGHVAGYSVFATRSDDYFNLVDCSTVALITSVSVILLLISGLPVGRPLVGVLMVTMWVSISATTVSFFLSLYYVAGDTENSSVTNAVIFSLCAWVILLVTLIVVHCFRFVMKGFEITKRFKHHVLLRWRKTFQSTQPSPEHAV